MKKILIILGNYLPNPSSVSNCVQPLINKLFESGFEIDIVTDRKRADIPSFERYSGVNIYRVDDYRSMNTILLNELVRIDSTWLLKMVTRIFAFLLKSFYYIRYCLFSKEKGTAGWQLKAVISKCIELIVSSKYDAVMSISQPFKSHYVAMKLKKMAKEPMKWFMFEFDPFSYNAEIKISKLMRKLIFQDEYNMFNTCDKVFLTPELYRFYSKTPFNKFKSKFISVYYATMEPIKYIKENAAEIKFNSEKINCLFIGRIYKDIRNPQYILDLFSKMPSNIHLTLITNYNIDFKNNRKVNSDAISILPLQSRDTAMNSLINADILVNIGNTVEFQVPGKIFEYMSSGKPIIHFSKFQDDPALIYLCNYPRILIVNEWEKNDEEQFNQIIKFCELYKGYTMSFEEVSSFHKGLDKDHVSDNFAVTINSLLD